MFDNKYSITLTLVSNLRTKAELPEGLAKLLALSVTVATTFSREMSKDCLMSSSISAILSYVWLPGNLLQASASDLRERVSASI